MLRKLLLGAVLSVSLYLLPAEADTAHITYEFSIDNAPGGIGDFSWEVTTLGLLPLGETTFINFNQVSPPSAGGGCQISSVLLLGENGGIGITTFFAPLCDGLFDSETSGFAVNPGQLGIYSFSGTNPDNSLNSATFRVFQSNLPVTTPEPSTFALLAIGVLVLVGWRKSTGPSSVPTF
jgi:PEP-CTERM motif